ncbi:hypothetical protein Syun_021446 [Stephania yunnanensis]|uniref:Uncharacterized protein n=1 Tax=Stephania yunnanensis TaxID=152371 RepID=A0AAP0IFM1_9MAGN
MEGLGEGYDGDIAFASALEIFGGGHNDPISVAFGGFCIDVPALKPDFNRGKVNPNSANQRLQQELLPLSKLLWMRELAMVKFQTSRVTFYRYFSLLTHCLTMKN